MNDLFYLGVCAGCFLATLGLVKLCQTLGGAPLRSVDADAVRSEPESDGGRP